MMPPMETVWRLFDWSSPIELLGDSHWTVGSSLALVQSSNGLLGSIIDQMATVQYPDAVIQKSLNTLMQISKAL